MSVGLTGSSISVLACENQKILAGTRDGFFLIEKPNYTWLSRNNQYAGEQ